MSRVRPDRAIVTGRHLDFPLTATKHGRMSSKRSIADSELAEFAIRAGIMAESDKADPPGDDLDDYLAELLDEHPDVDSYATFRLPVEE